jgi:hypothetical protein
MVAAACEGKHSEAFRTCPQWLSIFGWPRTKCFGVLKFQSGISLVVLCLRCFPRKLNFSNLYNSRSSDTTNEEAALIALLYGFHGADNNGDVPCSAIVETFMEEEGILNSRIYG